jgi:DNA-binding HxlR family transcriptional regulator
MKRKSLQGSLCPVARALHVIGDWWSLLIIYEVIAGPKRFGEMQRDLGVAKNILATRLKALSAEGIVEAVPASDGSVYQEYVITIMGRALLPTLVALAQWSSEYLFERREARSVPIDAKRHRPLKKLILHSEDGQLLDAGEILIRASGVSF